MITSGQDSCLVVVLLANERCSVLVMVIARGKNLNSQKSIDWRGGNQRNRRVAGQVAGSAGSLGKCRVRMISYHVSYLHYAYQAYSSTSGITSS